MTPHVILQQLLPAGECREVALGLEGGRYRLRTLRLPGGRYLVAGPGGAASIHLPMTDATWPGDEPTVALQSTLSLDNRTGEEQLLILERLAFTDLAVTGAEVTALQRFRDLFASEALRPGERISVGSLAVLFTDLYGSTQLYNKTGDATAFGQVMRHFDYLKKAIADHDGTLTKTMGDAIMAVFRRPVDAVQAVFEAQQALAAAKGELGQLHLKAGIHFGHAIAVTMNDRLDYFGSTINMAARLQGLSRGSDLVLSEVVYGDDEVAALLNATASALRVEDFIVDIRGFEEQEFSLRRLALKHLPVPE